LNRGEKASAFPQVAGMKQISCCGAAGFYITGGDDMETIMDGGLTNYKTVVVKLGDGTILNGKVNVPPNGRLSDVFTSKEKTFVIIVESDSVERSYDTIVVNKQEVVWAEPDDASAD
jgi:hypothetical protein